MKKVAFIAPTYPVLSETFIQTEVDSIQSCGHEVCVLTFGKEPSSKNFNYDIVEIGSDVSLTQLLSISPTGVYKALDFVTSQQSMPKKSLFVYGLKLAMQLSELKVNHVHAHFGQHTAAHAIVAAKLLNISCSFVAHGHDVYESPFDIEKKIQASDFVVAVCKTMQDDFNNIASGDIKLLHCGVKTDLFVPEAKLGSDTLKLVFLGRLVYQKGVQDLINALIPIADELNISLDIIGKGELEQMLKRQVVQARLMSRVRFLGSKPHSWVKKNLSQYDCLVAPFCYSDSGCVDTGPLVLKEAMAVGTPVITTNIMGCKEIVSSDTGYLVNEKSVSELTESITRFAKLSLEQRKQMGEQARARVVEHFDARRQAMQLSNWIENTV
ncbi:glycosyltransferase family 4 protein [Photobacterium satsumensis]|uniref:glycosyltransferase family 4 protein n=1 Tax=Photobacterium satsumensis TaxID=2910239 RepID=UPI003D0A39E4